MSIYYILMGVTILSQYMSEKIDNIFQVVKFKPSLFITKIEHVILLNSKNTNPLICIT